MNLDAIAKNPMIKSLLFTKLKGFMKENNVTLLTVKITNDEIDFEAYLEPMKVMTEKDFSQTIKALTNDES